MSKLTKRALSLFAASAVAVSQVPAALPAVAAESDGLSDSPRYKVFDVGMTWQEAEAYCESIGGHLVTITSAEEQKTVEELLNSRTEFKNCYWLGAIRNDEDSFQWVTGEPVDYSNWNIGQPDNSQGTENAATIFNSSSSDAPSFSLWNDIQDFCPDFNGPSWDLEHIGFICEFDDFTVQYNSTPSTYQVFDLGLSFRDAEAYCESIGGHLVTITSAEEQKTVEELLKAKSDVKNNYWIGLSKNDKGSFEWITGEASGYSNWNSNNPNNIGGDQNAVLLYGKQFGTVYSWDDIRDDGTCNNDSFYGVENFGFICEFDGKSVKSPAGHGRYQLFNDGMSWQEAETYCESVGGHLVTITSAEEQTAIEELLKAQSEPKNSYWLGALRNSSGSFQWVTNEPMDYKHWVSGQPDNANGNENALMIYYGTNPRNTRHKFGLWNDLKDDCTCNRETFFGAENFGFICEYEDKEIVAPAVTTTTATAATTTTSTTTTTTSTTTTTTTTSTSKAATTTTSSTAQTTVTTTAPATIVTDVVYTPAAVSGRYALFNEDLTWEEAKNYCQAIGGHLATISSQEEQDILTELAQSGNARPYIWLGGHRDENGDFFWITGEDMDYTNWNGGEPNNTGETCLMMYTNGFWNDCRENSNLGSVSSMCFICEFDDDYSPADTTPAETTSTTTTAATTTTTTTTTTEPVPPEPKRLDIDGTLTVKEMSIKQIEDAGIDLDDPMNYHVFRYETKLTFETEPIVINHYVIEALPSAPSSSDAPQEHYTITYHGQTYPVVCYQETVKEQMYMIITGECKWLKEFYDVELIVINKDSVESLTDCSAKLDIPDGLTPVNCDVQQDLGILGPGQAFDVHWYIRGDKAGDYDLSAVFSGKNRGEEFDYLFRSKDTLHVFAGDALKMKVTVPKTSYLNVDYPVKISFKNVSDKPIYNIEHTINGFSQSSVSVSNITRNGEPFLTGVLAGVQQVVHTDRSVFLKTLNPGDEIVAEITIRDLWRSIRDQLYHNDVKSIYYGRLLDALSQNRALLSVPVVNTIYRQILDSITVEHILKNVSIATLSGSTTEIPCEVEIVDLADALTEKYEREAFFDLGARYDVTYINNSRSDNQLFNPNHLVIPGNDAAEYFYNYARFIDTFDNSPFISRIVLGSSHYYRYRINNSNSPVQFYVRRADGNVYFAPKAGISKNESSVFDDFDVEIVEGDYSSNEDGSFTLSSDAVIKVTPKTAGAKAALSIISGDENNDVTIPVEAIDEHECSGDYVVVAPPANGNGAVIASFCDTCGDLIKCYVDSHGATAMFSNGELYQDIRGAIADAAEYGENPVLSIFGNVNIPEDVTIPENITLIIVPDTNISVKSGCKLVAEGTVLDFSGKNYDLSGNAPIVSTTAVTDPSGSSAQSTTTTTTTTAPAVVNYGDMDDNGFVDSADATIILTHYTYISTGEKGLIDESHAAAADVNGDGYVDAVDASLVLNYYAYVSTETDPLPIIEYLRKYVLVKKA